MKMYLLLAFKHYGIFYCKEEPQPNKEIFLIGKFNNTGGEYLFIKHPQDIEITNNLKHYANIN